jgi:hypothetical protein
LRKEKVENGISGLKFRQELASEEFVEGDPGGDPK